MDDRMWTVDWATMEKGLGVKPEGGPSLGKGKGKQEEDKDEEDKEW